VKVAIIRLSSLGDVVYLLGSLSEQLSVFEVTWIVDEDFADILSATDGITTIAIPLRRAKREKNPKLLPDIYRKLKELPKFDRVIDMQGLIKSAFIATFLKGEKWGFDRVSAKEGLASLFYNKTVSIGYGEHIATRNFHLLNSALGTRVEHIKIPFLHPKIRCDKKKDNYIVFAIGASKDEKRYPKELFCELANMLEGDIYIIYKGKKEREDAEFIATNSKAIKATEMGLDELTSFISKASLLIGNDSGIGYIAWGLGVRTVLLFGPTDVKRFCPKTKNIECLSAKNISDINPLEIAKACLK